MARLLSCFKKAFGRPDKSNVRNSDQEHTSSEKPAQETLFQQQARQIAQIPVAGMQRTAGTGPATNFVTTYAPVQARGPGATAATPPAHQPGADNATYSTDATLVTDSGDREDKDGLGKNTASAWKGKPNGTAYDSRQELTEEDEDMWARMAM
ncbi:hypothetical protein BD289DRAFT_221703 [Coniella lustricola]|uniref:Uncharacterized protein n=1 Tax=Coniella lustricola TaxID=2025994 RepID=A0A2T3AB44_9PEZI|nr:hypothetical protein BD289DRAFT_221703 [Coniella lustricola]